MNVRVSIVRRSVLIDVSGRPFWIFRRGRFLRRRRKERKREWDAMRCEVCGCTDLHACPGGCSWVRPGLCSACG